MPNEPSVSDPPNAGTTPPDLIQGPDPRAVSEPSDTPTGQDGTTLSTEAGPTAVEAGANSPPAAPSVAVDQAVGQPHRSLFPRAAQVGVWAMAALGVVVGIVMLGEF